jgi:hypothetical protein
LAKSAGPNGWFLLETVLALGVLALLFSGIWLGIAAFSKPLRNLVDTETRFATAQNQAERLRAGVADPAIRKVALPEGLSRYQIEIRPGLTLDYVAP